MQSNNKNTKLIPLSRIRPKKTNSAEIDTVLSSMDTRNRRAFDILMEAQHYWSQMDKFRRDRERNKRYTYGDQWKDKINVDGKTVTEEDYIKDQGKNPLVNNHIRKLVRSVLGVYRSQSKEPTCTARDRSEQKLGEVMTSTLQYNMQLNQMSEVNARSMEEFLISGLIAHRKSYGWRNDKDDCWTDYVQPNNFFIDNNMRDFRGWDISFIGEVHDISFGQLCEQFATSVEEYGRLRDMYKYAANKEFISKCASEFGYSKIESYDFLFTSEAGRCRVIEVWRKEQKPRFKCHDPLTGDVFKIDEGDYEQMVTLVNNERIQMATLSGMPEAEIPLIKATWFVDNYWYFYYLSPFGDILKEGETPYDHKSHPYVFKAYPFIDGEIHSFVADVIDQQRYTNRLISLYDWIMQASAKGVLMMPEDCLPDGVSPDDIADRWASFDGVIVYKPNTSRTMPQQIASNSTNIGIAELLNIQLQFFEDISGVNGALQGKPGYSGESAAHFNQQTQNATTSLLDILESFSTFVVNAAYKDVKNIQQYYDSKRVFNITGKAGADIEYDPQKIQNVEFDLSITESTTTPAYRHIANDMLMQLWTAQAISVEQLLEHGDFPFADDLLQSIQSQKEQIAQGQTPEAISPQLMQQVQQGADMENVSKAQNMLRG